MSETSAVIHAFSEDHVVQLTGLSKGQLRYWDATGFFSPGLRAEDNRGPYSRVYNFRDVVGLRALSILRNNHGVSLQHLRDVAERLSQRKDDVWADTKLYVLKSRVHFREPATGKIRSALEGQYAMIPLVEIINDVDKRARKLKKRAPEQIGQTERHRYVAHNARVFAGTRIPIAAIQRFHEAGYSVAQIMKEYPSLNRRDVGAAIKQRVAAKA